MANNQWPVFCQKPNSPLLTSVRFSTPGDIFFELYLFTSDKTVAPHRNRAAPTFKLAGFGTSFSPWGESQMAVKQRDTRDTSFTVRPFEFTLG